MQGNVSNIDLSGLENRSVLIIDDNTSVHRDYRTVFCPDSNESHEDELERLEAFLLDEETEETSEARIRNFNIQAAFQGKEAHELVKTHIAKGIRYPVAFVDMRMPPGWDGKETIQNLRHLDPKMKFVIVTAYSDHSDEELEEQIGEQNLIQILRKPFNPSEIYSLAYEILCDWNAQSNTGT